MPTVQPQNICMHDLMIENSEMIKTILQMSLRLNEFLFCDINGGDNVQNDNKPDCMMKEMLHQQDLMKQSIDILGNTLTKLGG